MILLKSKMGKKYFSLSNSSGKKWIFDYESLHVGLCLYQPSSAKGRLIKKIMQICSTKSILQKFMKSQTYLINKDFEKVVKKIFGRNDIQYSIFFGTPGVHCKMVGQISIGNNILGYFKVTDSKLVHKLFQTEFELLSYLQGVGIDSVPTPICIENIDEEYAYFQTTKKTINSILPIQYDELINEFLCGLSKKTSKEVEYKKSLLYRNIHDVNFGKKSTRYEKKYLHYLTLLDTKLANGTVNMCVAHRDFTPWNMFIENEELFVFDWEYASRDYLPMMDMFHFEIQHKIMDEGLESEELVEYIDKNWERYRLYISENTTLEACWILHAYLLDFIALYVSRNENLSNDELKSIEIRFDLLQYVESKHMKL